MRGVVLCAWPALYAGSLPRGFLGPDANERPSGLWLHACVLPVEGRNWLVWNYLFHASFWSSRSE